LERVEKLVRSSPMINLGILKEIGQLIRRRSDQLTAAPIPARWRDIIDNIELEEMFADRRESERGQRSHREPANQRPAHRE
jgi:hypothetical protein